MDMFDGFVFLEEKKKSLIPILCQYDFLSALTAAFSITSWRKNRGAQESCLALNSAMVENTEWGRKTIFTPNDLEEFFQLLYPILKTTPYDDPVLPDFGEIKLNYRSKYYSVITGTGHTAPIFSALQFLEKISESACIIKIYRRYHPLQIPWYSFAVTLCPTKIPSIMSAVKKQRSRQIN